MLFAVSCQEVLGLFHGRGKFGSQTSNMWTEVETVVRAGREEKESEDVRTKKIKAREHQKESQDAVFFQCFVAPAGQRVGYV